MLLPNLALDSIHYYSCAFALSKGSFDSHNEHAHSASCGRVLGEMAADCPPRTYPPWHTCAGRLSQGYGSVGPIPLGHSYHFLYIEISPFSKASFRTLRGSRSIFSATSRSTCESTSSSNTLYTRSRLYSKGVVQLMAECQRTRTTDDSSADYRIAPTSLWGAESDSGSLSDPTQPSTHRYSQQLRVSQCDPP